MKMVTVVAGDRYGRFRILREVDQRHKHRTFECMCDCGTKVTVGLNSLRRGTSQSCGCLRSEKVKRHGMHRTPEYGAWTHMIDRCRNPKSKSWRNYGGRGISVCESWVRSFASFFSYVGTRPSNLHSLDRFPNNDGNYEPGNVRWATISEQRANKRVVIWQRIVMSLASESGIEPNLILEMVARGDSDVDVARWIAQCFRP